MRRVLILAIWVGLAVASSFAPASAETSAAETAPAAVTATDARVAGDARRTRLIVDLTATVSFRAFLLADPYRVVVDLPQIAFAMPADIGKRGKGLVTAYRFGLIAPGKSRMVLDLDGPVAIDKAFVLDPADGQPARLVVDLVRSDRATFTRTLAAQPRQAESPPEPKVEAAPDALPVVVLDPGHGGIDAGASAANGDQEKMIVLQFAKALADKITQTGHYKVVLTRSDDTFVTLAGRIDIARRNNAALFISIHADTLPDPFGVRGATIYTLSDKASDAESARYAEKENRADAIAGVDLSAEPDDVADILIDLTRRETKSFSNQFAKVLIDDFKDAAALNKNPHRSAGFRVLKAPDVPSVLLELGYLSNKQDVKLLTSDDWRDTATAAVLKAIDAFFAAKGAAAVRDAGATAH